MPQQNANEARAARAGGALQRRDGAVRRTRVAALERFPDPSRRCEPPAHAGPGDELVVWSLPNAGYEPGRLLRSVPRAAAEWLRPPAPGVRRRALLRACLATGGGRLGSLVRAPELARRVASGEVDRVACFSAKEFALASYLAGLAGTAPEETIARGTKYFGEFGFELLAVVPYAYWLHRQGRLEFTVSSRDTRCLYYFSPRHEERAAERRYVPITEYPAGRPGRLRYDDLGFPSSLDTSRWLPPPYASVYADGRFGWSREVCVVCNKASAEPHLRRGFAVNFLDTELLLALVGKLRTRYQVVYSRPGAGDIVPDHQPFREAGEIDVVKRTFPDVLTIQELHARHPGLSFNELQLRLYAGVRHFVSVLGGASYLASYFGGTNVVYARRGWEVSCGAYSNWFHLFSGARVVAARTPGELLDTAERELLRRA